MKLSDYVVKFLEKNTDSIFLLSGGGIMHLVDSVGRSKLNAYCCHHEQAAAIAAEGYARIKNDIGVCLVTTGPGGTNAVTGVAGAWLDSIPILVISGQVKRDNIVPRKNGVPVFRALGFQELNVIDIVKPITKYAVTVEKEADIRYHLEKAVYLAKSGRPGPVWVEIPLDVQGPVDAQTGQVDPKKLRPFVPSSNFQFKLPKIQIDLIVEKLQKAKKPLLLVGNGIRLSGGEKILWQLIEKLKINVVTALFTADDLVTDDYSYYLGRQGMPGNESANYAIDNCDLLLVIGERLQLTQTSYDYKNFAKDAFKIMVDIDAAEMHKKTVSINVPICCDAKLFLQELSKQNIKLNRWEVKIQPINPKSFQGDKKYLNVYKFLAELGKQTKNYHLATANGMASLAAHQALKIKRGQRFITNAGLGQMGSGLPLAIGACIADHKRPVICMEGDGSIMLNIHELQTMVHHNLPLKIFIFNNNGYYSIKVTHAAFFKRIFASTPETGVSFPNFEKLIKAWGIKYEKIAANKDLYKVKKVIDYRGAVVCELMIDPDQPMLPKWTAGKYRLR
ncbi:MAG TPA: thiamine pyrophosphate-binding protein [Candidatus Bathyarchaeia archaeon]|nr:thiamine pyrophosphate-binding protein [Candidatus Bathyarchaeia archaeon]